MIVTLTFDNGPSSVTPAVLDTLAKHGVRATFFVLGSQMADPVLRAHAERAFAEGHRLGNHSYSHSVPFGALDDPAEAVAEISSTQELIGDLAGEEILFRPFGGGGHIDRRLLNPDAVGHLERNHYTVALWTSVPRDWEDPAGWVDRALADCASADWSVVVLHDLPTGAMAELDQFLSMLIERGAEFRQSFPPFVTPLLRGRRTGDLAALTSSGNQAAR